MYSPTSGRFMQTDPIGYEDQFNLYAYVGNDPVNLVDPDGTCAGPLIIPCATAAEEIIITGASADAAACVAYCPSAEEVKEAIDGVIDKVTPDPVPEIRPAPTPSNGGRGERAEGDGPRGGTSSEARKSGKRGGKEYKGNARPSTEGKHQGGQARKGRNAGGEKGDARRRPPRRPPDGHKGPYPPKKDL